MCIRDSFTSSDTVAGALGSWLGVTVGGVTTHLYTGVRGYVDASHRSSPDYYAGYFDGNVKINSYLYVDTIDVSQRTDTVIIDDDLKVIGGIDITGGTSVGGDADITGNVTIGGTIDVTGAATFSDGVDITNDLSVGGDATITGDLTVGGLINVDTLYITTIENNLGDTVYVNDFLYVERELVVDSIQAVGDLSLIHISEPTRPY